MTKFSMPALAGTGVLALALSFAVFAHGPDHGLEGAATAPAVGAALESVSGVVHHLTIDDRVAGVSLDVVSVTSDDGRSISLRGAAAVAALHTGDRITATGRRNGKALFVESARVIVPGSASGAAKSALATYDGTLKLLHVDYPDERSSEYVFELHQDDGVIRVLQMPLAPEALQGGMRVRVSGRPGTTARSLVPDSVTVTALAPAQASTEVVAKATRTNSALVILMTFTDSPAPPFTSAQVQNVFAGGPGSGSVTEFFKEASYGQQLLSATVTAWLPTNSPTPAGCDWQTMGQLGRNAATAAGYNVAAYQNLVYVFPNVSACGWIGLGYIGASGAWINGRNATSAYGHELGHNFGLLHAGSVRCSAGAIGGSCSVAEYGDPFDTMGNQSAMHYNAPQKLNLGWIPGGSVITHQSGSNTYTLSPLELAGGTTYAVKVPAAANRTYWLEYRQPIGFDGGLSAYPNNGVQVRVASPFETMCSGCDAYSNDTELLDMTPGTSAFTDAALIAGNSFTDPTYGITFNVLSANSTGVTVQVSMPGSSPAATSTTVSSSANPAPAGANVTFTATVTGSSPTGTVSFTDAGTSIAGCAGVALAGTGNASTAACNAASLSAGTHSIVASYSGDAANAASSSAALSQVINAASNAFANGGFESPTLAGGYSYGPVGATWSFGGGAGITGNGNAFTSGNPAAPEGVQVAFLQNAGTMTQVANLAAGQYTLSFKAAQRGNYQLGTQVIQVLVDGTVVGQYQPSGSAYGAYQTGAFSLSTSGSHVISLAGIGSCSDCTAFIDDVRVINGAPAPTIANASFEAPAVSSYQYGPPGASWTFAGGAGISANGSAFTGGNPAAPQGGQVAFLQGAGAQIAQTVNLAGGQYVLGFSAAQRGNYQSGSQVIQVLVDGVAVGQYQPADSTYASYQTAPFAVAASGNHTIALKGIGTGTDFTAFVDSVVLSTAAAVGEQAPASARSQLHPMSTAHEARRF